MIEKLKRLGLTSYESKAYLALLKLGDAEADEIAMNAKIPMGRIYNVLSTLEEIHLVRSQDTRPRKYACVDVPAALERLSKNKKEELEQKAAEIDTLISEVASELSSVSPRRHDRSFWTVAKGNESLEFMQECISGAQKELLFFFASKMRSERIKKEVLASRYSQIMAVLDESLSKGVETKVIFNRDVDVSSLADFPAVRQLLAHMEKKFEVRFAAIPTTPFDIIDGQNVLLQMLNPLNPEELLAVISIRDTKLAEELRKKFFTIWDNAEVFSGK